MSVYRFLRGMPPKRLEQIMRRIKRKWRPSIIESLLREALDKSTFFVQIGSNDGKQGDPLYETIKENKAWRGIFVEPIPYLHERLIENYGKHDRFRFVNVAISEESGDRDFYYVDPSAQDMLNLPFWYDQLGSFDPEHIRKHFGDRIIPFIVCQKVPCQTLNDLLSSNSVARIDLIHIDAEGYDHRILSQLDFARYGPKVVIYEHKHLAERDQRASIDLLTANGHRCLEVGDNTIGVRR